MALAISPAIEVEVIILCIMSLSVRHVYYILIISAPAFSVHMAQQDQDLRPDR